MLTQPIDALLVALHAIYDDKIIVSLWDVATWPEADDAAA